MANSCLYTKAGGTAEMHRWHINDNKTYPSGMQKMLVPIRKRYFKARSLTELFQQQQQQNPTKQNKKTTTSKTTKNKQNNKMVDFPKKIELCNEL